MKLSIMIAATVALAQGAMGQQDEELLERVNEAVELRVSLQGLQCALETLEYFDQGEDNVGNFVALTCIALCGTYQPPAEEVCREHFIEGMGEDGLAYMAGAMGQ